MKQSFLFLLLNVFLGFVHAQKQPSVIWEKTMPQLLTVSRAFLNNEGNIVVLGHAKTPPLEGYFGIFSPEGKPLLEKKWDSINACHEPFSGVQTATGAYFIVGIQCKTNILEVTKLSVKGDIIWQKTYDKTISNRPAITADETGVYITAAHKRWFRVFKIDFEGINIWDKTYPYDMTGVGIVADFNKKIYAIGHTTRNNATESLALCLSTEGVGVWEKTYPNAYFEDVILSKTNELWATGYTVKGNKYKDALLLQINTADGKEKDRSDFGGFGIDIARSLVQDEDGNAFLIGWSTSRARGERFSDMYVMKTNEKGKETWWKPLFIGKGEDDMAHSGILMPDGKLFIAGESNDMGRLIMLEKVAKEQPFTPKPVLTEPIVLNKTEIKTEQTSPPAPTESLDITWVTPDPDRVGNPFDYHYETIKIEVKASSSQPLEKDNFHLFINDRLVEGAKFDNVKLKKSPDSRAGAYKMFWETELILEKGINKVTVEVGNKAGRRQSIPLGINRQQNPNLYLLSIGIPSDGLKFTAKDAEDVFTIFKKQEGVLFEKVYADLLNTPEKTTLGNLIQSIGYLREGYEIRKEDLVVIFISSHGFTDKNDAENLYIMPSDAKSNYARASLDFKKEVRDLLNIIPGKKLLLIDACHSGAGIKSGYDENVNEAIVKLMTAKEGMRCIVSSRANEKSHEHESWQNGAFTKAIMEALNNEIVLTTEGDIKADKNDDKILTLNELYDFLKTRVPFMVNKTKGERQHPALFNIVADDALPIFILPK